MREAKALVASAWVRGRGRGGKTLRVAEIANGRFRPLDPWFRVSGNLAVRRLSPNNRKIEAEDAVGNLLMPEMLRAMGFEIANVHLGTGDCGADVGKDLRKRKRGWLTSSAKTAAEAIARDYGDWRS